MIRLRFPAAVGALVAPVGAMVLAAGAMVLAGCGGTAPTVARPSAPPPAVGSPTTAPPSTTAARAPSTTVVPPVAPAVPAPAPTVPPVATAPTSAPTTEAPSSTTKVDLPVLTPAGAGGPATFGPTATGPLDGKVIAIDPGHNGGNGSAASIIDQSIFNGRSSETCDTTGTETDGGYTESRFNWNVAQDLAADLRAQGSTVVLTRTTDTGVGPCVTERAAIGNGAHADAAVSIHADGGPPGGRGFAILEPVGDGPNDGIVGISRTLGSDLRDAFAAGTGEPVSSYDGVNGIQSRDDLAGTNLSTVPKVFIECANMRNSTDAALVTSAAWQAQAAQAIAAGLVSFVTGG